MSRKLKSPACKRTLIQTSKPTWLLCVFHPCSAIFFWWKKQMTTISIDTWQLTRGRFINEFIRRYNVACLSYPIVMSFDWHLGFIEMKSSLHRREQISLSFIPLTSSLPILRIRAISVTLERADWSINDLGTVYLVKLNLKRLFKTETSYHFRNLVQSALRGIKGTRQLRICLDGFRPCTCETCGSRILRYFTRLAPNLLL